jgi:hypothetical protein
MRAAHTMRPLPSGRLRWVAGVLAVAVLIAAAFGIPALLDSGSSATASSDRVSDRASEDLSPPPAAEAVDPSVPQTTVPAGDGTGSIHDTVEVDAEANLADPVAIDETADFGNGVRARVSSVEPVDAEAHLPGEFSGPAVALTVEVTNGSRRPINLDTVTVDLTFDGLSAYPVRDPERRPVSGDLAPGDSTSGSYVFTLDHSQRDDVALRITYSAKAPTVVFSGSIADG